jgi:hypothetical protein
MSGNRPVHQAGAHDNVPLEGAIHVINHAIRAATATERNGLHLLAAAGKHNPAPTAPSWHATSERAT